MVSNSMPCLFSLQFSIPDIYHFASGFQAFARVNLPCLLTCCPTSKFLLTIGSLQNKQDMHRNVSYHWYDIFLYPLLLQVFEHTFGELPPVSNLSNEVLWRTAANLKALPWSCPIIKFGEGLQHLATAPKPHWRSPWGPHKTATVNNFLFVSGCKLNDSFYSEPWVQLDTGVCPFLLSK